MEQWKDIKGFEGEFQVSNFGGLKNVKTGRLLKTSPQSRGYLNYVFFRKGHKPKSFLIHRLVAMHFIHNPENLPEVNHKDFNKNNNHFENLEWVTSKENIQHAVRNGRLDDRISIHMIGSRNPQSKLNEELVKQIKDSKGTIRSGILAEKYSVSTTTIRTIWRGLYWKRV